MKKSAGSRRMRTVGAKVSDELLECIDELVKKLGLESRSDLVRRSLVKFVESSGIVNPRLTADLLPSEFRMCPCLRSSLEKGEPPVNAALPDPILSLLQLSKKKAVHEPVKKEPREGR